MYSCRSTNISCCLLLQIIQTRLHSNFPPKNLLLCLLRTYLHLANLFMSQGIFPSFFKGAQVSPLLKKAGLDKDTPSNYRPISNLNNISKLLERLILNRIQDHTTSSSNFNLYQIAYRQFHFTETALLLTHDCIFRSIDQGSSMILVSLDLSAAFDTIDHSILLNRLYTSYGIHGSALTWFKSYLSNRRHRKL